MSEKLIEEIVEPLRLLIAHTTDLKQAAELTKEEWDIRELERQASAERMQTILGEVRDRLAEHLKRLGPTWISGTEEVAPRSDLPEDKRRERMLHALAGLGHINAVDMLQEFVPAGDHIYHDETVETCRKDSTDRERALKETIGDLRGTLERWQTINSLLLKHSIAGESRLDTLNRILRERVEMESRPKSTEELFDHEGEITKGSAAIDELKRTAESLPIHFEGTVHGDAREEVTRDRLITKALRGLSSGQVVEVVKAFLPPGYRIHSKVPGGEAEFLHALRARVEGNGKPVEIDSNILAARARALRRLEFTMMPLDTMPAGREGDRDFLSAEVMLVNRKGMSQFAQGLLDFIGAWHGIKSFTDFVKIGQNWAHEAAIDPEVQRQVHLFEKDRGRYEQRPTAGVPVSYRGETYYSQNPTCGAALHLLLGVQPGMGLWLVNPNGPDWFVPNDTTTYANLARDLSKFYVHPKKKPIPAVDTPDMDGWNSARVQARINLLESSLLIVQDAHKQALADCRTLEADNRSHAAEIEKWKNTRDGMVQGYAELTGKAAILTGKIERLTDWIARAHSIAEGSPGWETDSPDCPMLDAVYRLKSQHVYDQARIGELKANAHTEAMKVLNEKLSSIQMVSKQDHEEATSALATAADSINKTLQEQIRANQELDLKNRGLTADVNSLVETVKRRKAQIESGEIVQLDQFMDLYEMQAAITKFSPELKLIKGNFIPVAEHDRRVARLHEEMEKLRAGISQVRPAEDLRGEMTYLPVAKIAELQGDLINLTKFANSVKDRIKEATGATAPSGGHDWVDEIIGLLRVTRGQRDDSDGQLLKLRNELLQSVSLQQECEQLNARQEARIKELEDKAREKLQAYWDMKEFGDEQVNHMVDRFLQWQFPANMSPDGGISLTSGSKPVGTNLLDATQATAMVRHMLEGLPEPKKPEVTQAPLMSRDQLVVRMKQLEKFKDDTKHRIDIALGIAPSVNLPDCVGRLIDAYNNAIAELGRSKHSEFQTSPVIEHPMTAGTVRIGMCVEFRTRGIGGALLGEPELLQGIVLGVLAYGRVSVAVLGRLNALHVEAQELTQTPMEDILTVMIGTVGPLGKFGHRLIQDHARWFSANAFEEFMAQVPWIKDAVRGYVAEAMHAERKRLSEDLPKSLITGSGPMVYDFDGTEYQTTCRVVHRAMLEALHKYKDVWVLSEDCKAWREMTFAEQVKTTVKGTRKDPPKFLSGDVHSAASYSYMLDGQRWYTNDRGLSAGQLLARHKLNCVIYKGVGKKRSSIGTARIHRLGKKPISFFTKK